MVLFHQDELERAEQDIGFALESLRKSNGLSGEELDPNRIEDGLFAHILLWNAKEGSSD